MNFVTFAWQDLRRQKLRSFFAIGGVFISLFMLTIIGCLADSLAYSYINSATFEAGSADLTITKIQFQDLNFDPYFSQESIEDHLSNISEIDGYYPRIMNLVRVTNYDPVLNIEIRKQIIGYGINTTLEQERNKMGNLWLCDDSVDYVRQSEVFKGPINPDECLLTRGAAILFNAKIRDIIEVQYGSDILNLSVQAIVDPDLRFSRFETTLIILELPRMQEFLSQEGKVNYYHATFKNPELLYNSRDIPGSLRAIRPIAEQVQDQVGFEFEITIPKMEQLENAEQQSMQITMIFSFITFFSIFITAILVNGILLTAVEERIREYGIMRVLGGKRAFTFKVVFMTGVLIAIFGTFLGTMVGTLVGPPLLDWIFKVLNVWQMGYLSRFSFLILPRTVFRSLLIGLITTIVISLFPAIKAGRGIIANDISPARNMNQEKYKLKKEGSINLTLIGVGFGIGLIGIFLFLVLPRLVSGAGGPNVMNYVFVGVLLVILMGLVFATLGVVPLLESLIAQIFKPFIKKYYEIYRINLVRYRRRNNGSILLFAITFAFIFFISSEIEMSSRNSANSIQFQYGADLVLSNTGNPDNGNAITLEMLEELRDLPGIRSAAPIFTNAQFDVVKIMSAIYRASQEGFDAAFNFEDLFGTIPKLNSYAGDLGNYHEYYANLIAVDETYYDTIDQSLAIWDRTLGTPEEAIQRVITTTNSCIIAKSLADGLGITQLPASIRITMVKSTDFPDVEGETEIIRHEGNVSVLTVVGISKGMPGVWNFRSSELNLETGAGILVNIPDYCRLMQWGEPNDPKLVIDKILINLRDNSYSNLQDARTYITNYFNEKYKFLLDESVSIIQQMESNSNTLNTIMQAILFTSILICLFGLISAMYSTLEERMFEIGILRAMGLKTHEIRSMLIAEATTIMISSGTLGAIIGWFIAYLIQTNIAIITELPVITAVNLGTLTFTYAVSIAISVLGMFIITRKVSKWSVMEILRKTF